MEANGTKFPRYYNPEAKYGNGYMAFNFGTWGGIIHGGPYRQRPGHLPGIKMAQEIHEKCFITIPTKDFQVPNVFAMRAGILQGVMILKKHRELYVGCAGGIGRTGLYLGCMSKLMLDYWNLPTDPVQLVRDIYLPRACETQEQEDYVRGFVTIDLVEAVRCIA